MAAQTIHGTVEHTIVLAASPPEVFAAFAEFELRRRWFRLPGRRGDDSVHEFDFRVGGTELLQGSFAPLEQSEFLEHRLRFLDIVTDRRVMTSQELRIDGILRSASIVTFEFAPTAAGTRVDYLEQYVFLDVVGDGRPEHGERRGGTRLMLNALSGVVVG